MTGTEIAAACRATVRAAGPDASPVSASVDSRLAGRGEIFFGLQGSNTDGGRFAAQAARAGAWGAVISPRWAERLLSDLDTEPGMWVIESEDPLTSLHGLARQWRRLTGATTIGITGSAGKTTTKDVTRAVLPGRVHASPENWNTEIGLPLAITEATADTDFLVLEMAMRGRGQIAELADIAEPDIGLITNAGPVHTELLGSVGAVAAAKAELLHGLAEGAPAVVPASPGPLGPEIGRHRDRLDLITFGRGGDIEATVADRGPTSLTVEIGLSGRLAERASGDGHPLTVHLRLPFTEPHNVTNLLGASALGILAGVSLEQVAEAVPGITFSPLRGERLELTDDITLLNDCYNANPISLRAALDHLGAAEAERRVAVLGPMAELGRESERHHAELGAHARERGVELLIGVGREGRFYRPDHHAADAAAAAELLAELARPGDTILVKGSRSAELEQVAEAFTAVAEGRDG